MARLLLENKIVDRPDEAAPAGRAQRRQRRAGERIGRSGAVGFSRRVAGSLASLPADSVAAAKNVIEFVDSAGKDAGPRRARGRLLAGFAIDFFRLLLRRLNGMPNSDDAELAALVERAINNGWTEDAATAALDRCLETLSQIDRNANQTTMIECWMDDLAEAASGKISRLSLKCP